MCLQIADDYEKQAVAVLLPHLKYARSTENVGTCLELLAILRRRYGSLKAEAAVADTSAAAASDSGNAELKEEEDDASDADSNVNDDTIEAGTETQTSASARASTTRRSASNCAKSINIQTTSVVRLMAAKEQPSASVAELIQATLNCGIDPSTELIQAALETLADMKDVEAMRSVYDALVERVPEPLPSGTLAVCIGTHRVDDISCDGSPCVLLTRTCGLVITV